MRPSIEYLQRKGSVEDFVKFPCTILTHDKRDKLNLLPIVVHRNKKSFCIKKWMITECNPDTPLPPLSEVEVEFVPGNEIIPSGYTPLQIEPNSFSNRRNSWRHPMSEQIYSMHFNTYLKATIGYHEVRENALWRAFYHTYKINFPWSDSYEKDYYGRSWLKEEKKSKWKVWKLWTGNMLKTNVFTPPELMYAPTKDQQTAEPPPHAGFMTSAKSKKELDQLYNMITKLMEVM